MENDIVATTIPNGVIIANPTQSDWKFGGETGIDNFARCFDWTPYLPSDERQNSKTFDSLACVTYSAVNSVETQIDWLLKNDKIPQSQINQLIELGFFDDNGNFNCSDRFTAKMSGTTALGNSGQNVFASIRHDGLLPEKDWPFDLSITTRDQYYVEIPQELKNKAKKILDILDFSYQWVVAGGTGAPIAAMSRAIKIAPLQIFTAVCNGWYDGTIVKKCDAPINHATMCYSITDNTGWMSLFRSSFVGIEDSYPPFQKRLAMDYNIPYVSQLVVDLKKPSLPSIQFRHNFTRMVKFGERSAEVVALQDALKADGCFPTTVASTGYFGTITKSALSKFQIKYSLPLQTGIVDTPTINKLNSLFNV